MKRIEIIANSAVEQDIVEIFEHIEGNGYYTKINNVHGLGSSGPRQGDHIWPEENAIFIVYGSEEEADLIQQALVRLKVRFPDVGIKYFVL